MRCRNREPVPERCHKGIVLYRNFFGKRELPFELAHEPPEHVSPIGAIRGCAYKVDQHEIVRVTEAVPERPVGEECRLPAARITEHDERRTISCDISIKTVEIPLPRNVDPEPARCEGLISHVLAVKHGAGMFGVGKRCRGGCEGVDHPHQVFFYEFAELDRIAVILTIRQTGFFNPFLEGDQLSFPVFCSFIGFFLSVICNLMLGSAFEKVSLLTLWKGLDVRRVAEVKVGIPRHRRVVLDAMKDLEFCDGFSLVICYPGVILDDPFRCGLFHPAIAFAEHADEVRAAFVNELQAGAKDFSFLLFRDSPSQVHLSPSYPPFFADFPECRKDP